MNQIHILDSLTANKIAAGEVVERPVSVVKELAENAIDAGATDIEVEIAEGGVRYIRVSDNGSGMNFVDARQAFVRHATSKIKNVEDIFSVSSLGFRGEALPSIASVSKIRMMTRKRDADTGFSIVLEGGNELEGGEVGVPVGTTIEVQDLFYNTPARKKFLKTERTESGRINSLVGKLAMAHTDIAFRLINNGRKVIETPGNGNLMDTIAAVYGTDMADDMFPIEFEGEGITICGAVGKPSVLKSSRQWQTFVVNQRVIESPLLARALDNAYHSLLPKNGYPVAVLLIQTNPAEVDVNVHPQKKEIKFVKEQVVFRNVYHAVLDGLTAVEKPEKIATEVRTVPAAIQKRIDGIEHVTQADFKNEAKQDKTEQMKPLSERFPRSEHRRKNPQVSYNQTDSLAELQNNTESFNEYVEGRHYDEEKGDENLLFTVPKEGEEPIVPLGQVAKCFIVCQKGDSLYIIDQHAAHERIRYDSLASSSEGIPAQQLLVPVLIRFDSEAMNVLTEYTKELKQLGFTIEQAGPNVVRLTEAPADTDNIDNERMLREIVSSFLESHSPSEAQLRHRVLSYASCRGAIKAGHELNIRQMRQLIKDLFATERPFVCPHGRPVIVRFSPQDLANLFNRT